MKGRKPKSNRLKILNGNPGGRSVNPESDAPFVAERFSKPRGLDRYASKEWDRLVKTLAPILSPASSGMVLIAAESYSEWMTAKATILEKGHSYITTNKAGLQMERPRPEVSIAQVARRSYQQALCELGASPVAHTRVKKLPEQDQPELPGMSALLG